MWSACDCRDGGTETRERTCADGQFGGKQCPKEKDVEKRACEAQEKCPGKADATNTLFENKTLNLSENKKS